MTFEIKDYFETPVILEPRVELYTVYDFMGKELPGLAIVLDMPIQGADEKEQFAILTKSFEEFIGLKNSAYVDINNCPFAPQLLNRGFAKDTGLYKESGFCSYPLWTFDETVLKETGGEKYERYARAYDEYMESSFIGMMGAEDETGDSPSHPVLRCGRRIHRRGHASRQCPWRPWPDTDSSQCPPQQ